jgi:DNA-binding IclR family transcriptional regulator
MSVTDQLQVKSAYRTLAIIEFIAKSQKPPSFTAILRHMDIPKSSLSVLMQDLVSSQYIDYDADTRVYYPGLKLIQLSAICMNNTNIAREISLGIKKLSDELGETTHAGILDGRHVVYIAKHHGSRDVSVVATIGLRIPAHATAIGKVLLAALPADEVAGRFAGVTLERYTDNTLVDLPRLWEELARVAAQGYAVDNQEIIPGGICVAAPIIDKTDRTVAAVSLTLAAAKADGAQLPVLVDKIRATADQVSMRLGKL